MSRIGLRLGAAHIHHHSALDHKPRQPWAVRNMKEEMMANERKPWQPPKPKQQLGTTDEEDRPTACVGICYYNKLMALEAKEDLANHNMVYKNQPKENGEPCDNQSICNDMDEDITLNDDLRTDANDSNVIVIDDEAQEEVKMRSNPVSTDTIYIDDDNTDETNKVDISKAQFT